MISQYLNLQDFFFLKVRTIQFLSSIEGDNAMLEQRMRKKKNYYW